MKHSNNFQSLKEIKIPNHNVPYITTYKDEMTLNPETVIKIQGKQITETIKT
jgi:hypothetical protein